MRYALIVLALISAGVAVQVIAQAFLNAVDLRRRVVYDAAALSLLLRDWGLKMVTGAMMPFGAVDPGPSRQELADRTRPPVILVPGYGMNRACMWFLDFYLRKRGFPLVWSVNNRPHSAAIAVYAERLGQAVQRALRESGARQVDIVAHSAGGVIAAWYINQLGGAAQVRRLVTLGTPWQGTWVAIFGRRAHAADLLPDSMVVQQIQRPAAPTFAIWTRNDGVIFPNDNARADGMTALEVTGETHVSMLYSATVFRMVRDVLLGDVRQGPVDAEGAA